MGQGTSTLPNPEEALLLAAEQLSTPEANKVERGACCPGVRFGGTSTKEGRLVAGEGGRTHVDMPSSLGSQPARGSEYPYLALSRPG